MKATYYDQWGSYEDVTKDYGVQLPPESQIVYAGYTYEDYSGSALVVWCDDKGQWWENNDGHCSCYGLECWGPEATDPRALLMRNGWVGLHEAVKLAQLTAEAQ